MEKVRLEIREDLQTTSIEVTTSSLDVAGEEQFLFTQAKKENDPEEQTLQPGDQSRQDAKE